RPSSPDAGRSRRAGSATAGSLRREPASPPTRGFAASPRRAGSGRSNGACAAAGAPRARRWWRAPPPSYAAPQELVGGDGDEDEPALDDLLVRGVDVEQVEAVSDDRQQHDPDEAAPDCPVAAEDARAADDRGRDRGQLVAGADVRLRRLRPRGEQHAGEPRREPRDGEAARADDVDADSRQARRLGVSAHGVDVAAEGGPGDQHDREHREAEEEPADVGDAEGAVLADVAEAQVVDGDDVAARDEDREAAVDDAHGQRADERVDPCQVDGDAVGDAETETGCDCGDETDRRRRRERHLRRGDARDADHGADGEVEDAREDADRLADRQQPERAPLVEQVGEVPRREEVAGGEGEREEERDERDGDAEVAQLDLGEAKPEPAAAAALGQGLLGHAASVANAAASTRSIVASSLEYSATIRPRRMTTMRCARPRTSSSSDEMRRTAMPSRASRAISSWICRFAPTSTPRVGSSASSTLGVRASHFANSAFCWFPPESVATGAS